MKLNKITNQKLQSKTLVLNNKYTGTLKEKDYTLIIDNKKIRFHKKLHALFTDQELKILANDFDFEDNAFCSMMYFTDIGVEIYCDCEAKDEDKALISLYDVKENINRYLSKEEFLKIYFKAKKNKK